MSVSDDYMNELRPCPMCNREVPYGDMIWLNGKCTCEICYIKRRAELDRIPEAVKRNMEQDGES